MATVVRPQVIQRRRAPGATLGQGLAALGQGLTKAFEANKKKKLGEIMQKALAGELDVNTAIGQILKEGDPEDAAEFIAVLNAARAPQREAAEQQRLETQRKAAALSNFPEMAPRDLATLARSGLPNIEKQAEIARKERQFSGEIAQERSEAVAKKAKEDIDRLNARAIETQKPVTRPGEGPGFATNREIGAAEFGEIQPIPPVAPTTNITFQAETKLAEESAKAFITEEIAPLAKGLQKLQGAKFNMARIERSLKRGVKTGALGNIRLGFARLSSLLGLSQEFQDVFIGDTASAEDLVAASNALAVAAAPGARNIDSIAEVNFYIRTIPNLINTREGNDLMLRTMNAFFDKSIEISLAARDILRLSAKPDQQEEAIAKLHGLENEPFIPPELLEELKETQRASVPFNVLSKRVRTELLPELSRRGASRQIMIESTRRFLEDFGYDGVDVEDLVDQIRSKLPRR